jgi:hypothetical protein
VKYSYINECTDEGKFGTREYNRGHRVKITAVVVGHVEISSGKTFLIAVHVISTRTLMATIKEWILPGMTVISDCWGAYRVFEEVGGHILG